MTASVAPMRRFMPGPPDVERMSSAELRRVFLLQDLFEPGQMRLVYTDLDRLIVGGVTPDREMRLNGGRELGTAYFTERREIGIFNLGGAGVVTVGAAAFQMNKLDCLYVGMGEQDVRFGPAGSETPEFYFLSCPAHRKFPTAKVARGEGEVHELGDPAKSSRRRMSRCIHPGGAESCQLVMGFTEVAEASVWNTMPPHTHGCRSEVYLYLDLADNVVVHLMGHPESTRHLIVRDREAVLSPSWSIHSGAGTRNYRFIWGMAGENTDFDDMDPVAPNKLW